MINSKKATPTERTRVDLINFIIDATADQSMSKRFLDCNTPEEIRDFFENEGYCDIPLNDCEDILTASKKFHGRGVDKNGNPVDLTSKHGY